MPQRAGQMTFKQYTEVRFASFLSGGLITAIVVNLPERKLAKHTIVQYVVYYKVGINFKLEKISCPFLNM